MGRPWLLHCLGYGARGKMCKALLVLVFALSGGAAFAGSITIAVLGDSLT
ncbi:MAG: hypothetical protein GDA36_08620, partial [Rhodobacteraceae bacterium]|nr:hypothetical protein [Paracoccaceae bacterium]